MSRTGGEDDGERTGGSKGITVSHQWESRMNLWRSVIGRKSFNVTDCILRLSRSIQFRYWTGIIFTNITARWLFANLFATQCMNKWIKFFYRFLFMQCTDEHFRIHNLKRFPTFHYTTKVHNLSATCFIYSRRPVHNLVPGTPCSSTSYISLF